MVGDLAVRLLDYRMPAVRAASTAGPQEQPEALLELHAGDGQRRIVRVGSTPVRVFGRFDISLRDFRPDVTMPERTTVDLAVDQLSAPSEPGGGKDVLVVEASVKPFINLVWSGVLVLLLGLIVTIVRRAREARGE